MLRIIALTLTLLLLSMTGCGKPPADVRELPEENPPLAYFKATYPERPVVKWALGDVNADGRLDLAVIYGIGGEANRLQVVLDLGGRYQCTGEVPAPVENQHIQFRDIDNKPPTEIIVQGSKGARSGLAVYRVEGGTLTNLFDDNMIDCCK